MQPTQWSSHQIKQCKLKVGQAVLSDEHTLALYSQDFGKLCNSNPSAVCIPPSISLLQTLIQYANENALPITIRGNGMSQGGQALPMAGGLTVHLQHFNQVLNHEEDMIWVEANASWADLLEVSLTKNQIPYVIPYNCHLSVGGVLSAGGVGASSFKYGSVSAHVAALEVVTADGDVQRINPDSDLFHACLSGQGRFGVITKAAINLRPCQKQVRTFFLVYEDKEQWMHDLYAIKAKADYIEAFCSPAVQGAKLVAGRRMPFAQWLYAMHVSIEYDEIAPELRDISKNLHPWKLLHTQDESIYSYLHRHDSRFEAMKMTGQWELLHPWYECFIATDILRQHLDEILAELPVYYATILQIVPLAVSIQKGFLMLPDAQDVSAVMILNAGVNSALLPGCLQAMAKLDKRFLTLGGKRYLSGYLGNDLPEDYWQQHFGRQYGAWQALKNEYDPKHIFTSSLHQ